MVRSSAESVRANDTLTDGEIPWVYDSVSRTRLFPWDALFGELSPKLNASLLSCSRPPCNYTIITTVHVPYLPLWKRIRNAVHDAFSRSFYENNLKRRPLNKLRFGDVVEAHEYLLFVPLHASLCSLVTCLRKREGYWKERVKSNGELKNTGRDKLLRLGVDASVSGLAKDMYFILHWLLDICWGRDVVRQCHYNDSFGSSKEALNPGEARLILFLAAVGIIPGAAKHLSHVLRRRSCFVVRTKRRRVGCGKVGRMQLTSGGLVVSDENRGLIQRLTNAFLNFEVPCCCFGGLTKP
ncbi:methyltransferase type 12 [Trypanosoma rangeli]|uniref:Methyltransferase type 12 n=1 Tax=Trypanosoma rangeli TaxID=5698 RepID=A0A3R7LXM3_TRYRA|nr:methyltransferase type 12 [Trypanosoma rangeli]RNF05333.1 methyltransferase type 12 [Trypanosoma rangeli]|eukprot:RNF05333.1 methyltransferase type 12 [Trypanosoma rangeli]